VTAVNKFKALVLVTTCVAGCTSGAEQNTPGVPLVSGIAKQSTSVMLPGNTSTVQNMANAASVRPTVALDGSSRVSSIVEVVSICGEMTTMQLVCNLSISRCSLERKRFVEIEKITVAA